MTYLQTMYPGVANSPGTFLKKDLVEDDTTMYLADGSVLGTLPTLAVIGGGADAETVLVTSTAADGGHTIKRGVEGEQKAWKKADLVARNWTNKDYEAIRANIEAVNMEVLDRQYLYDILMGESLVTRKAGEWPVVHGKPTKIEKGAFENNQLVSVTIPNSVKIIDERAFYNNQLTSVTIPRDVKQINNYAFCKNNLTSVIIPGSTYVIGEGAFEENRLSTVVLEYDIRYIGKSAFKGNYIQSINIPNSVISIGDDAFRINDLYDLTVPFNVRKIGHKAFAETQLTEVKVPKNCTVEDDAFDDDVNIIRY